MANADITVSIERAINDALRELFQSKYNEFGILITRVDIDWAMRHGGLGAPIKHAVASVQCSISTEYGPTRDD